MEEIYKVTYDNIVRSFSFWGRVGGLVTVLSVRHLLTYFIGEKDEMGDVPRPFIEREICIVNTSEHGGVKIKLLDTKLMKNIFFLKKLVEFMTDFDFSAHVNPATQKFACSVVFKFLFMVISSTLTALTALRRTTSNEKLHAEISEYARALVMQITQFVRTQSEKTAANNQLMVDSMTKYIEANEVMMQIVNECTMGLELTQVHTFVDEIKSALAELSKKQMESVHNIQFYDELFATMTSVYNNIT